MPEDSHAVELQPAGSLEEGSLRCWDVTPHSLPWSPGNAALPCLLFPGAQRVFQALSSHPLPRANSPWSQGSVFALPVWLVGSAPALIPYHGTWAPKSGGSAHTWCRPMEPITCSQDGWEFSKGEFAAFFLLQG